MVSIEGPLGKLTAYDMSIFLESRATPSAALATFQMLIPRVSNHLLKSFELDTALLYSVTDGSAVKLQSSVAMSFVSETLIKLLWNLLVSMGLRTSPKVEAITEEIRAVKNEADSFKTKIICDFAMSDDHWFLYCIAWRRAQLRQYYLVSQLCDMVPTKGV
jgi:hypothetical protein